MGFAQNRPRKRQDFRKRMGSRALRQPNPGSPDLGDFPAFGYNGAMERKEKRIRTDARFENAGDLRSLGYQVLLLANQGLLRTDFQREISRKLIDYFGCDSVEVWLKDHEKYYPSETTRPLNRSSRIDFRTYTPHQVKEIESGRKSPAIEPSIASRYKSIATIPLAF